MEEEKNKITKEEAEIMKWVGLFERDPKVDMSACLLAGMPPELEEKVASVLRSKVLREVYNRIKKVLDYYLDIDDEQKTIIALWIIGTYHHPDFETYPYLFINAMRGSAKSRALKLIISMSYNGNLILSPTEAVLFRTKGTLGIDEFETLMSKEKQSIRELLNASYKKGVKVFRMKKQKTLDGDKQVVEEFEPYRPIALANIAGIEEVLSDRCITLIFEKSSNPMFTKIIEDFDKNEDISWIIRTLSQNQCSWCRKVYVKEHINKWNEYVKNKYINTQTTLNTLDTLPTLPTLSTLSTLSTQKYNILFEKIDSTNVNGRNLELFFPLFLIAESIGEDVLEKILKISKNITNQKNIEELIEGKDYLVHKLVANCEPNKFYKIKELTENYRFIDDRGESDWITSKWMLRSLKRLNLIINKRRVGAGIEVQLSITKSENQLNNLKNFS